MNWPYLAVGALAGTILIIFASYVTITGFTVNEEFFSAQLGAAYTEQVGVGLADGEEHDFVPTISCYEEGCGIISLKISGEIHANRSGTVRVYVDDDKERYLVLEESILLGSHDITESVMSEENVSFFNETTNETEVQTFYTTHENTYSIEEPGTSSFKHVCDESCEFFLASRVMYSLSVEAPEDVDIEIKDVTYVWEIPGREIVEIEVLNDSDVNMTTPELKNETNMTLSPPIVSGITGFASVDFSARENVSNLPANWFVKSEPSLDDVDSANWEWEPYSDLESGINIPLGVMKRPQEEYASVEVRLYSRTVEIQENASLEIEFVYDIDARDECAQLTFETYGNNSLPETSYMITLSGKRIDSEQDFSLNYTFSDRKTTLRARTIAQVKGKIGQFSLTPLCYDGTINVQNLTYMFINNFEHYE